VVAAFVAIAPVAAHAQALIKVNDSISVRVGFLSQTWADFAQNQVDGSYSQDLFQRRIRLIVSAQVGSKFAFYFQTDNPNLGRAGTLPAANVPKNLLFQNFITQDAYVEVKPSTAHSFVIEGGLLLVPFARNVYAQTSTLLPLDYDTYISLPNGPTGSNDGRDMGFELKGTFFDQKLEYRAGVFSGARLTNPQTPTIQTASNSLRGAGHLMFNFWETEAPAYVLPGTYLGKKKVFNIGAGYDGQSRYKAIAGDAFLSYPIGSNGVTLATTFIHYDGGTFFPTLPRENTLEVEGGYHFTAAKVTPWVKYERRMIDDAFLTVAQDEHRLQLGGTYYMMDSNLNMKFAYTRGSFAQLAGAPRFIQNEFTFQLQGYYY
jgi:hypothetical protein